MKLITNKTQVAYICKLGGAKWWAGTLDIERPSTIMVMYQGIRSQHTPHIIRQPNN